MNPNLLGGIEIGALVAVILLGMVTVQIYVYYMNFPLDSRIIKALITLIWVTEAAHAVATCHGMYKITVTRYGHLDLPIPLELCMAAILGNAIHPVVQAIFIARIYQFSKHLSNRALTAICWAISGFTLGATVLLSIKVFAATSLDLFEEEWDWLILGLFGATGGVDLLIAASMCFYTLKNRAILKVETGTIDTIISWTAQTGLFTCMAAIAVAVCFATMRRDHVWLPLLIVTTGIYSNSLLSLLNGRLNLGYQTESPFVISLSTFRKTNRSRGLGNAQFSYPPNVHLELPPPATPKPASSWAGSTRAGSTHAESAGMTSPHYTLARMSNVQQPPLGLPMAV
ncbi:hypothetical protein R3P38DRAFT_2919695 [Favolaschia claudopus]|uniref:DUF6534 domain-containing protein n=1 Tax=Favolaschia claudopus TaxID=2862362 RepID=A0AAW0C2Q2_9AGAR